MRKRILIIDDETDIRDVASASLELVGEFDVLTAASAQEGISVAAREVPDAILLDLMMPEMDGCQVLEHLKRSPVTAEIPVILLTAKAHAMSLESVQRAGAAGVLLKPFDPMLLPQQVRETLRWSEQADEAGA